MLKFHSGLRKVPRKFNIGMDLLQLQNESTKTNSVHAQEMYFPLPNLMAKHTHENGWFILQQKERFVCFVCKLFTKWSENDSSLAAIIFQGFDDWAHCQLIQTHENSRSHRNFLLSYLTRRRGNTLPTKHDEMMKAVQDYWKHVLERVVEVICLLAERGLRKR